MRITGLLVAAILAAGIVAPAHAQVAWDAPMMVSPGSPDGWGFYLVDPWPGEGIGFMTAWRGPGTTGFRVGLAEEPGDDLAGFGGVDLSGDLVQASADFPLDVGWLAGVGIGVGDAVLVSFPLGVAFGRVVSADNVRLNPYFSPRVVVDGWLGDDRPRDDLDLEFAFDLGVDLAFSPAWAIRFGASVADREALGIGFSLQGL